MSFQMSQHSVNSGNKEIAMLSNQDSKDNVARLDGYRLDPINRASIVAANTDYDESEGPEFTNPDPTNEDAIDPDITNPAVTDPDDDLDLDGEIDPDQEIDPESDPVIPDSDRPDNDTSTSYPGAGI
jgi:hypothetical protein